MPKVTGEAETFRFLPYGFAPGERLPAWKLSFFANLNADKFLEAFQNFTVRSTGETPTRLLKARPGMGR